MICAGFAVEIVLIDVKSFFAACVAFLSLFSFYPVIEHVKDKLIVMPCFLLATLIECQGEKHLSPWGATGEATPSPVQSIPERKRKKRKLSPVRVCPTAASCSADLACVHAEQREKVQGRIRVPETLQSHCGQPAVCWTYTAIACSQSTHLICSDTAVAELAAGSNTPPTDSTSLLSTMQHKSGSGLIWRNKLAFCRSAILFN